MDRISADRQPLLDRNTVAIAIVSAASLYFLYNLVEFSIRNRNALPLPPEPRGLPILGKLPEVIKASKKGTG